MLFRWEKHGALVRHAFPVGKAWRTGAPRFLTHDAKRPWQNLVLPRPLFPCAICAQKAPTHYQVFWLMQPGANLRSTPRAASHLLMSSRPQWPPFGAKPRSCKYSYGVSPGFPPGSFYPRATQRSSARRVIQCIIFLFIIYHFTGPCQPFSRAQPQNVPRQPGPPPKLPRRGHVTPGFVTLLR